MESVIETELEESQDMGSLNHSIIQTRIAALLYFDKRFTSIVELSLDISTIDLTEYGIKSKEEIKPDICLYPNSVGLQRRDILKMKEMPLLAIEVVSPRQGLEEILAKFDAYFFLGIQSCWLVTPTIKNISIYSQPDNYKTFDTKHDTEVVDEKLNIRLSLEKIFE